MSIRRDSGRYSSGLLFLAALFTAQAQPPQINPGGVRSAASYATPIAPGEIIAIFGTNFVPGSTTVTVNGISAPVLAATGTQVNAIVPAALLTAQGPTAQGLNLLAASVVVTTPAGSSAAEVAALAGSAPGFFTADSSGCGQASALNIRPDGSVSVNSASNSAAPGDYIALFGTGLGNNPLSVPFSLDYNALPPVSYAGAAPGLPGVQQVNFQVPASTRNGCGLPLTTTSAASSATPATSSATPIWGNPPVTIAVQSGRGQCVDPPISVFGSVSLGDTFSAQFTTGYNLQTPPAEAIVFAPQWAVPALQGGIFSILSPAPLYFRNCPVPGYGFLSAGTIQIQPPSGAALLVPPSDTGVGPVYGASLPPGVFGPGTWTISGTAGSAAPLEATIVVGSPIQVVAPPAVVSQSQPLTVKWTGGDSASLVRVQVSTDTSVYSYAPAAAGSLTLPAQALQSLAISQNAQITVLVLPATPKSVSLPGISGPVIVSWQYSYSFTAGLGI